MPRHDGNTISRNPRHHKAMKSPARGKGHDAKIRRKKQEDGQAHRKPAKKPQRQPSSC